MVPYPGLQLSDHALALTLCELFSLLETHGNLADLDLQLLPQRLSVAIVLLLAAQLVVETRVLGAQAVGAVLGGATGVQ